MINLLEKEKVLSILLWCSFNRKKSENIYFDFKKSERSVASKL